MKFIFVLFLVILGTGVFAVNLSLGVFDDLFFQRGEQKSLQDILKEKAVANLSLEEPEKEVFSPDPLRIFQPFDSAQGKPAPSASLSGEGVWQWTNVHRQQAGLPALSRDALLDQIAAAKLQDMFNRQYFAHVSPQGVGIGDWAEEFAYEFIAVGENLALGNFARDEDLVQAWMDSPGHRANILGARFQEIGIAAEQGLFEGNSTWLAVQVFALPLAACDVPSEQLKKEIDFGTIQIGELALMVEQMRAELQRYRPKAGPSYNQKVEEYNALVDRYNSLVAETQANIRQYNTQVQAFNTCAQS